MIRKVLVVCEGNICRSPLACALLARALPHIGFSSAGTHARTGEGADPLVAEMARVRGVNLAGHVATPLTDERVRDADLVLTMTHAQREQIETAVIKVLFDDYGGRILPFDAEAALRHGQLRAQLRRDGRPTQDSDALIAAIALSHSATIATRNIKHFEHCGVELIDPWSS